MKIGLNPEIETPFDLEKTDYQRWHGSYISVDETEAGSISIDDFDEVLYQGKTLDEWDGFSAAVIKLYDGRLVAWETLYGPTGSGFSEDAYGGDANVYFAKNLSLLVKAALSDEARRLLQIPEELWK